MEPLKVQGIQVTVVWAQMVEAVSDSAQVVVQKS
jgi:hypothetical protein